MSEPIVVVEAFDLEPGMVLADRPGLPLRSVWAEGPGRPMWVSASTIIARVIYRVPLHQPVSVLASSMPERAS